MVRAGFAGDGHGGGVFVDLDLRAHIHDAEVEWARFGCGQHQQAERRAFVAAGQVGLACQGHGVGPEAGARIRDADSLLGPQFHGCSFAGSWQSVTDASFAARPAGSTVSRW